jgi:hypothetical protein
MPEKPTPEEQRMLKDAAALAADVLLPQLVKRRGGSMQSIRALKAFVKNVEGCEPHEIQAAIRWLVARFGA